MKKIIIILTIAVSVVGGVLCVKPNSEKDLFENNVEVLAQEEMSPSGFGSMCVTNYENGNLRYFTCFECENWVMCNPLEIKYCH